MKGPCDNCPFRKDRPFALRHDRAQDIAEGLLKRGESFHCHKTIDYGHDCEELDDRPFKYDEQFCGGALVVLTRMGHQTQMMQIAERLGIWSPDSLDMNAPVYEDLDEFISAMDQ